MFYGGGEVGHFPSVRETLDGGVTRHLEGRGTYHSIHGTGRHHIVHGTSHHNLRGGVDITDITVCKNYFSFQPINGAAHAACAAAANPS